MQHTPESWRTTVSRKQKLDARSHFEFMNTLKHSLAQSALVGALLLLSGSPHAQQVGCPNISESSIAEAERILTVLGYDQSQSATQLESVVQASVKQLGAKDALWSSSHPKWREIEDVVRSDVFRDFRTASEAFRKRLGSTGPCTYAQVFGSDGLNSFSRYLSSAQGKRHLQFGVELSELLFAITYRAILSPASRTTEKPAAPIIQKRLDLIQSSLSVGLTQSIGEAIKRKGGDASGYGILGFIYGDIVSQHGEMLDALNSKYAGDLDAFREFNRSSLMAKNGEAWAIMFNLPEFKAAQAQYVKILTENSTKSEKDWKRRFDEIATSNPAVNPDAAR